MLKQSQINTNHKRPKYYIYDSQFRSTVQPSTYSDNYRLPKQPYFSLLQKQLISLFCCGAFLFLLLYFVMQIW